MSASPSHMGATSDGVWPSWFRELPVDGIGPDDCVAMCEVDARDPESLVDVQTAAAAVLAAFDAQQLVAQFQRVAVELVTNAMRDAGNLIEVWIVGSDTHLVCAVHDLKQTPPRPVSSDDGQTVIHTLAASRGWTPTAAGKVVWAKFSHPSLFSLTRDMAATAPPPLRLRRIER